MGLFEKKYKLENLLVGCLRKPTKYTDANGGTVTHIFKEYVIFTSKEVSTNRVWGHLTSIDGRRFECEVDRYSDFIGDIKPLTAYCIDIKEMAKKKYTKLDILETQKELTLAQLNRNGEK